MANIKWREKDIANLKKQINRYNRKRQRIAKKNPEFKEFLPPALNTKIERKNITTRREYNLLMNRINRFLNKKDLKYVTTSGGVKTTDYELRELSILNRRANLITRKERSKYNISPETGTMGTIQENNLIEREFHPEYFTQKGFNKLRRAIIKRSRANYYSDRNEQFKKNYLKAMQNKLRGGDNYKETYNRIKNMRADELIKFYYENPSMDIHYIYSLVEKDEKINTINAQLDRFSL